MINEKKELRMTNDEGRETNDERRETNDERRMTRGDCKIYKYIGAFAKRPYII